MGAATEQIRVSETVKRTLERHRRGDESYNDALERILDAADTGDFYDGFGMLSDEEADWIREKREEAKEKRNRRMRRPGETR